MFLGTDNIHLIVFAKDASERDFLRNLLAQSNSTILCFENETNCFDNIASIAPHAIIVRSDSRAIAWRFIFALNAMKLDVPIHIVSSSLDASSFRINGSGLGIKCIPLQADGDGLIKNIDQDLFTRHPINKAMAASLLVGDTPTITGIQNMLHGIGKSNDPVMITGEAGTGKELLARLIVNQKKADTVFIKIDCSAFGPKRVTENGNDAHEFSFHFIKLVSESLELQSSVTIFLDKIELLGKETQSEILLLLDEGLKAFAHNGRSVEPVIRYIATSEVDLEHMVKRNFFRQELFYRLNVIPVHLPPLRQRKEDISLLTDYFLIEACAKTKRSFRTLSPQTMERLFAYPWPGNVDELRRTIDRVAVSGDEAHILAHAGINRASKRPSAGLFPAYDMETLPNSLEIRNCLSGLGNLSLKTICDQFACRAEKNLMQKALQYTNWNRKKAAALLHISYKSMLNKMKVYDII